MPKFTARHESALRKLWNWRRNVHGPGVTNAIDRCVINWPPPAPRVAVQSGGGDFYRVSLHNAAGIGTADSAGLYTAYTYTLVRAGAVLANAVPLYTNRFAPGVNLHPGTTGCAFQVTDATDVGVGGSAGTTPSGTGDQLWRLYSCDEYAETGGGCSVVEDS